MNQDNSINNTTTQISRAIVSKTRPAAKQSPKRLLRDTSVSGWKEEEPFEKITLSLNKKVAVKSKVLKEAMRMKENYKHKFVVK